MRGIALDSHQVLHGFVCLAQRAYLEHPARSFSSTFSFTKIVRMAECLGIIQKLAIAIELARVEARIGSQLCQILVFG